MKVRPAGTFYCCYFQLLLIKAVFCDSHVLFVDLQTNINYTMIIIVTVYTLLYANNFWLNFNDNALGVGLYAGSWYTAIL